MAGRVGRWEQLVVGAYSRAPERPRRALVRLATPGYRVGALAAVVRPDGRLLLVDQPYVRGWSLPGGDLKRGEDPATGLARELREEIALHVTLAPLTLAALRTHDRWVTFVTRVEVTDDVAAGLRSRTAELADVGWFSPDALPLLHGDAVDPLRLVGVPARTG